MTKAVSTKHPEALQSMKATVLVVLQFAQVKEMEIWIDFDSLPATNTGTIDKEGDADAKAVLLFKKST